MDTATFGMPGGGVVVKGAGAAAEAGVLRRLGGWILEKLGLRTAARVASWIGKVGAKDAQILQAAQKAVGGPGNFGKDLGALARAVGEAIPGGQIHALGDVAGSPIYGSLVSRVGIAEVKGVTQVVSAPLGGAPQILGAFHP